MTFEPHKIEYSGNIKTITLGDGDKKINIGGQSCYPFYLFEGDIPNKPVIAMEVYDTKPDDWPETAIAPFKDVIDDPVVWAKKCVNEYNAEMICLQMVSTDPNGIDRDANEAAEVVKQVSDAVDTPLIVWGTANHEKDTQLLRKVAEICQDKHLILGPVEEGDYKKIGASAIGYKHTIVCSSPIDINLAKQLNILVSNLGVPNELLLMDPTVSSIGYGIEYAYSVMERIRTAALTQQDEKLQFPFICNIARETWKSKEAKMTEDEDPRLGNSSKRGILLEAMSAVVLLLAGADILIMRHPTAINLIYEYINDIMG
jgi:acetyl-CoA decarbonylase/synthase complex subunit delta